MKSYCVIQKNFDILKAADFASAYFKLAKDDALKKAKSAHGFLIEAATLEKSLEIKKKAEKSGIETLLLENKNLPSLKRPFLMNAISFEKDGFKYSGSGLWQYIPFKKINFISAALIREEKIMPAELYLKLKKDFENFFKFKSEAAPLKQNRDISAQMDIFASVFPFRLKIKNDEFDFSGLKTAKTYSSYHNFAELLKKISGLSKAPVNPSAKFIINGKNMSLMICESEENSEKEIISNVVARQIKL